jgi:glycosyltransferase involved in cell wall biosynthesis
MISIVIPSFNQGRFLGETLRSIAVQTYKDVEVVLVDNLSTDGSADVIDSFRSQLHITLLRESDRGPAEALNKGFQLAQGEKVGWMNADDFYHDRSVFARVVSYFQQHPTCDILHGDAACVDESGRVLWYWCFPPFNRHLAVYGVTLSQPTVFLRRSVAVQERVSNNVICLDYEFWLRLGQKYQFRKVHAALAADRDHRGRISWRKYEAMMEQHRMVADQYRDPRWSVRLLCIACVPFVKAVYRLAGLWYCFLTVIGSRSSDILPALPRRDFWILLRRQLWRGSAIRFE